MKLVFPRLYVILDAALLPLSEISCAKALIEQGVEFLQYRNKSASSRRLLEIHNQLEELAKPRGVKVVVNDRPDVAAVCRAGGVHMGQEDLPVEDARHVVGDACIIGVSTHTWEQFAAACATSADYIAVGPVFPTTTKQNADAVVGLEFVRRARNATRKPLVAVGGITLERAPSVWDAGADCVAVARDVICASHPGKRAAEYLGAAARMDMSAS